ncbi:MAG: hypothetical protein M3132_15355, partial [Actinomycetia bacterium]|nr:hypothetical protein [Actinomycetes bacterium]
MPTDNDQDIAPMSDVSAEATDTVPAVPEEVVADVASAAEAAVELAPDDEAENSVTDLVDDVPPGAVEEETTVASETSDTPDAVAPEAGVSDVAPEAAASEAGVSDVAPEAAASEAGVSDVAPEAVASEASEAGVSDVA